MFVTDRALAVTDLARACEARGLESLWVPEHPVVPVHHETRYPLSEDGKLPRPYTELPDCFVTLAAAAAVTQELRIGTGICLVPERDPLHRPVTTGAAPGLETPSLETIPGRDLLARYRDAGADRVIISLPTLSADDAYRHLDRVAAAAP